MLISSTALLSQDFLRSYNFDVILPDVNFTSGSILGIEVSPFIQGISFGQYSMEDINPVQHGSLKAHSAGMLSIKEISMDFICPAFPIVLDYFEGWRSLIYDSTNLCYFIKSNYVNGGIGGAPCLVTFYDVVGIPTYQWQLINIFPKTFPSFKSSYGTQEIIKFTVEFAVDFIIPNNNPDF